MSNIDGFFQDLIDISAKMIQDSEEIVRSRKMSGVELSKDEIDKISIELEKVKKAKTDIFTQINEHGNRNSK